MILILIDEDQGRAAPLVTLVLKATKGIDLLRLEMETLWERDAYGRQRPHPLVALAVAGDRRAVRFGSAVPTGLRKGLGLEGFRSGEDISKVLERTRESLASLGPLRVSGGRSYVFEEEALVQSQESSALDVLTLEEDVPAMLTAARPEAWWEPQEWEDLLAGRLGPWAIGMIEDRVAAVCHTPVGSHVAAEAGVWTHPEARGRGYAGIVTAEWARVARRRFETLFYSTGNENVASQAVARRLGLRPIGEIWELREDLSLG